jgi:flagella basal body P-ring formation protein FlgA
MTFLRTIQATIVTTVALTSAWGDAAEIQLRAKSAPGSGVVRLGDVATIRAADEAQATELASLELCAAPVAGQRRFLRLRQIQDTLTTHGIRLASHNFSGANQVEIAAAEAVDPAPPPRIAAPSVNTAHARRRAQEAIVGHLRKQSGLDRGWTVGIELNAEQARAIMRADGELSVKGGREPWTGPQEFALAWETADGPDRLTVLAQVELPGLVVVATRALPRGAVIHETDVELRAIEIGPYATAFAAIDDVVGKETTGAVHIGQSIGPDQVQAPLLVRRGEVITIYSRSPGIRIRTTGRARDQGSLGELITVESLADRKTFFARVCGVQEAEIFARAVRADRGQDAGE